MDLYLRGGGGGGGGRGSFWKGKGKGKNTSFNRKNTILQNLTPGVILQLRASKRKDAQN